MTTQDSEEEAHSSPDPESRSEPLTPLHSSSFSSHGRSSSALKREGGREKKRRKEDAVSAVHTHIHSLVA